MRKPTILKSKKAIFVISTLFLFALIMLPSVHSTSINDGAVINYHFNSFTGTNIANSLSGYTGKLLGTTSEFTPNVTGYIDQSLYRSVGTSGWINTTYSTYQGIKTIVLLMNITYDTSTNYRGILTQALSNTAGVQIRGLFRSATARDCLTILYNSTEKGIGGGTGCTDGTTPIIQGGNYRGRWIFVALMTNLTSGNTIWFVGNKTRLDNGTLTGIALSKYMRGNLFLTNGFDKNLPAGITYDELILYNRSVAPNDVKTIWTSLMINKVAFPFPAPIANFTLYAYDAYDSSKINTFNVSIKNGTKLWNFTTTTGIINAYPFKVNQAKPLVNITFSVPNYFTKHLNNYNISTGNINQSIVQAVITLTGKEKVTGIDRGVGATYRINYGATIYNNPIYIKAGKYNFTFNKTGYYTTTNEFTITAKQNITRNITGIYNKKLNITTKEQGGTLITGATINVTWLNASSYSEQGTATGASKVFNVVNGTYRIKASKLGSYTTNTKTYKPTNMYSVYNITLVKWNSFNITFKDEETKALVKNVSIELLSDSMSGNYTTKSGYWNVSLIIPENYTIRYVSSPTNPVAYHKRHYFFELLNGTFNNLVLYMVKTSTASNVTAKVYDQTNNFLEDVTIKVKKYDVTTNSYNTVEMVKTNWEGKAVIHPVLNSEYYKFTLEYGGVVVLETTPTYIYNTDTIQFTVILGGEALSGYYMLGGVSGTLTYTNTTRTFTFTYNDPDNTIYGGCLYVYAIANGESTLYTSSCVNSVSSTILKTIPATNGTTYSAKAYIKPTSTTTELFGALSQDFVEQKVTDRISMFMVVFLTIIFFFLGKIDKSMAAMLIPIPLFLTSMLNIVHVNKGLATAFLVLGLIVAYIMRRGDFGQ